VGSQGDEDSYVFRWYAGGFQFIEDDREHQFSMRVTAAIIDSDGYSHTGADFISQTTSADGGCERMPDLIEVITGGGNIGQSVDAGDIPIRDIERWKGFVRKVVYHISSPKNPC
jgi:hypothetical protein